MHYRLHMPRTWLSSGPVFLFCLLLSLLLASVQAQTITTVAGGGPAGFFGDGGAATSAQLNYPFGIAVDGAGNLYMADTYNNRIRKVTAATGKITTFADGGGSFWGG